MNNGRKSVILIVSMIITVLLVMLIWNFNSDISEHNRERSISTLNAMGSFAEEAEKYLEAESSIERKEIGQLLDREYREIVNNHLGVARINIPFLRGDQVYFRNFDDLIIHVFDPLWSLTYIPADERSEDSILERGKELNGNEAKFFSEVLEEIQGFKFTGYNENNDLSSNTRSEIIEQGRILIEKSRELKGEHLNN